MNQQLLGTSSLTRVKFPDKCQSLFTPAPFKVLEGGRGSSKSWTIAQALLILGSHRPLFIVCARETQKSIKDSVHKLLSDQIVRLNYHARVENGKVIPAKYTVLDNEIRGDNGTVFVFIGLNNMLAIKSMEGIDILWVTEAVHVSKTKWNILLPTVRRDPPYGPFKQGSEIWIDFNPELTSDDTYQMFVVDPPEGSIVIELNYKDNPFFPDFSRKLMEAMRKSDRDEYMTIWMGKTRKALAGSIFAKELEAGITAGRIGPNIKYMPDRPVILSFDLGDADVTAMWAWQQIGNEHNCIDYEEESGQEIGYFLRLAQERKYIIKGVWLPHDAEQKHQAARPLKANTIEKQAKTIFPQPGIVKIVPNTTNVTQISVTRALFPRVNINDNTCSRGVMTLQHFKFEVNPHTKERSSQPVHNWASHGAKGFMYYAVQLSEGRRKEMDDAETGEANTGRGTDHGSTGWMAR